MGKIIFGILCICIVYATLSINLPVTIGVANKEERMWSQNLDGGHPITSNTTIPVNNCNSQSCRSACLSSKPGGNLASVKCQDVDTCVCTWLNDEYAVELVGIPNTCSALLFFIFDEFSDDQCLALVLSLVSV
ncbi:hypothetical protein ACET3Z_024542 [Daucus carota]